MSITSEELQDIFQNSYSEAQQNGYSKASSVAAGSAASSVAARGGDASIQRQAAIEAAVFTEDLMRRGVIASESNNPSPTSAVPMDIELYTTGFEPGAGGQQDVVVDTTSDTQILALLSDIAKSLKTIATNFATREGFQAYQTTLNETTPMAIAPYSPERRSLVIRNLGSGTIFIGPDRTVSISNGQTVLPYDVVEITNDASAVYGISLSGDQIVGVSQE
jgi:hypothetical protein